MILCQRANSKVTPFGSVDRCFLRSTQWISEIGAANGPDRDDLLFLFNSDNLQVILQKWVMESIRHL